MMPETITIEREESSATMTWLIQPKSFISRHFELYQNDEVITTLRMDLWREGCSFSVGGHDFVIRKPSIWKDGFHVLAGDENLCDVKRNFWSRRFEIAAAGQQWVLQPAGLFSTTHQFLAGTREEGRVRRASWFSRRRIADFASNVPPPIQVLVIFLVLILGQRQSKST
jgi:hypothetical protein